MTSIIKILIWSLLATLREIQNGSYLESLSPLPVATYFHLFLSSGLVAWDKIRVLFPSCY